MRCQLADELYNQDLSGIRSGEDFSEKFGIKSALPREAFLNIHPEVPMSPLTAVDHRFKGVANYLLDQGIQTGARKYEHCTQQILLLIGRCPLGLAVPSDILEECQE